MRRARLTLAAIALAACDSLTESCTQIGCRTGISVAFATPPGMEYQVELVVGPDTLAAPLVVTCANADGRCPPVFFAVHRPTEPARVRVTTAAGTATTLVPALTYGRSQPNGARCGPTCHVATVEAMVPDGEAARRADDES